MCQALRDAEHAINGTREQQKDLSKNFASAMEDEDAQVFNYKDELLLDHQHDLQHIYAAGSFADLG